MTKKDKRYFDLARIVSYNSDHHRFKIGAVIVKKNRIIAIGTNTEKTHPIQKHYDKFRKFPTHHRIHAEIKAIINSKLNHLDGCSIYIYRETKSGHLANSRPCPSCIQMIKNYGIRKIGYSTNDGFCIEELQY